MSEQEADDWDEIHIEIELNGVKYSRLLLDPHWEKHRDHEVDEELIVLFMFHYLSGRYVDPIRVEEENRNIFHVEFWISETERGYGSYFYTYADDEETIYLRTFFPDRRVSNDEE